MATVIKGKRKGQKLEIHQFCNDWFYMEDGSIFSPTALEFTLKEFDMIVEQTKQGKTGMMFLAFEWNFPRIKKRR